MPVGLLVISRGWKRSRGSEGGIVGGRSGRPTREVRCVTRGRLLTGRRKYRTPATGHSVWIGATGLTGVHKKLGHC